MAEALSPELIVATARDILDVEGPGGLSMRAIAGRLDVKAASLYHHIPHKQAVLQRIVDRVALDVAEPIDPDQPWRDLFETVAARLRSVLSDHPGSTTVVATLNASPEVAADIAARFGPPLGHQLGISADEALLTLQSFYVLVVGLGLAEFGDTPRPPVAPTAFYDAWFELATSTYLDGIAARRARSEES